MPRGGQLTIEIAHVRLDADYAQTYPDIRTGRYVLITVTDTGSGMSEEVRRRAFEPFFTTKPTGAGTGLGLSMVYGFVKQSGGNIQIYSEVGRGTSVRVFLPLAEGVGASAAPTAVEAPEADLPGAPKPSSWSRTTRACAGSSASGSEAWVTRSSRRTAALPRWLSSRPAGGRDDLH